MKRNHRVAVVGALAVVGLAILGAAVLTSDGDEASPVSDTPSEPVTSNEAQGEDQEQAEMTAIDIAYAFMETRDLRDGEAAIALLRTDADILDFGIWPRTVDEYPGIFAWMDVLDWRWTVDECTETEAGPAVTVVCTHVMENDWSRARGIDPVNGEIELVVEDGLIIEVQNNYNPRWLDVAWGPFVEWLQQTHPADFTVMWRQDEDGSFAGGPATTPEAVDLFKRYTAEYVDAISAG